THPAHLSDNRNCVLCLTCAQACPHRSVQLALRPPAADIQREMELPRGEPLLLLVLAGDLPLHHAERLLGWLPWSSGTLLEGPLGARLLTATLALALPGLLYGLAHLLFSPERLRRTLYGLLPLLWALLLARHLPLGMAEAGQFLPVSLSALPAPWAAEMPSWSADAHVIGFCQSAAVLLGWSASVVLLRRQLATHRAAWLGASGLALALACAGRWLVAL
ncbi:MAG: 4Fe-4S binding protein, partial [Vulcanococcus sp.]